jgi:hypothetical protein
MKTKQLFQTVLTLLIITLFSSCTQDADFDTNTVLVKGLNNNFKTLPIKYAKVKYNNNYVVSQKVSSYNIEKDELQLEIPVPVNDFSFLKAYNVSTDNNVAILYVIHRKEQVVIQHLPTKYIIQDQLRLSDLDIDTDLLQQTKYMRIFVMNNSPEDMFADEFEITNCFKSNIDYYGINDQLPANLCKNNDDVVENGVKRPGTVAGGVVAADGDGFGG